MHILLMTPSFPPEVRSVAQIMFELAETLQHMGHQVTVLTAIADKMPQEKRTFSQNFFYRRKVGEIDVIGISTLPIHRSKAPAIFRGIGQLLNGLAFFLTGIFLRKVDISISYSPPMTLGLTGVLLHTVKRIPHVFNVQDLVPQYAVDLGILTNKHLIWLIKIIERFTYRHVQKITVHSKGNKQYIQDEGINAEKIHVVPNWVDASLVVPGQKDNSFRRDNNLDGKFVVLFAGILGFAQDLDTVIKSGEFLKEFDDIVILIVGEGVEKDRLRKLVVELGLENIRFHKFVPKEEYPEVVAASDICLAPLQKDLKCPVVPSKILGYMSGGRPVITALDLGGDAPAVIQNSNSGICVEPGQPKILAEAIIELYKDNSLCQQYGDNGRQYILKNHSREQCVKKYEELFKELCLEKI